MNRHSGSCSNNLQECVWILYFAYYIYNYTHVTLWIFCSQMLLTFVSDLILLNPYIIILCTNCVYMNILKTFFIIWKVLLKRMNIIQLYLSCLKIVKTVYNLKRKSLPHKKCTHDFFDLNIWPLWFKHMTSLI